MLIETKLPIKVKTLCFRQGEVSTLLLSKILGASKHFSHLREKYTSVACLFMSGFKDFILTKSLLMSILFVSMTLIFENSDV